MYTIIRHWVIVFHFTIIRIQHIRWNLYETNVFVYRDVFETRGFYKINNCFTRPLLSRWTYSDKNYAGLFFWIHIKWLVQHQTYSVHYFLNFIKSLNYNIYNYKFYKLHSLLFCLQKWKTSTKHIHTKLWRPPTHVQGETTQPVNSVLFHCAQQVNLKQDTETWTTHKSAYWVYRDSNFKDSGLHLATQSPLMTPVPINNCHQITPITFKWNAPQK